MPARTCVDVGHVADDRVAQGDVLLEDVVLVRGELAGLRRIDVRDADLADVVQEAGELDRALRLVVEAHPLARKTA